MLELTATDIADLMHKHRRRAVLPGLPPRNRAVWPSAKKILIRVIKLTRSVVFAYELTRIPRRSAFLASRYQRI